MNIRASQGGTQEAVLPEGAELQSVTINGTEKTIRPQNGVVSLPLILESDCEQQPWERRFHEKNAPVKIGSPVNATSIIHLNDERILCGPQDQTGDPLYCSETITWLMILPLF